MLHKNPKSGLWRFVKTSAKTLFVLEAIGFAVSYGVWYRMNTNREFRHYMQTNFPALLEGYYKVGEIFGDSTIRQLDTSVWTATATSAANKTKSD